MFAYESVTGEAFLIDKYNRLKAYHWTDTGIQFVIPDINKEKDFGKYKGDVARGPDDSQNTIEVKEIHGQSFLSLRYLFSYKNVKSLFYKKNGFSLYFETEINMIKSNIQFTILPFVVMPDVIFYSRFL